MPRSSRAVAQRYAAASRKRRKSERPQPTGPAASPSVESADSQAPAALPGATTAQPVPTPRPRPVARRAGVDYTEHYRYVWADIRRIAVIAGSLILGLIGLSFVIR